MRRPTLQIPTTDDTRRLIDAATETDYGVAVLLAATTGARRGELVRLRWKDVDLDAATLTVVSGKTDTARRTVNVPASTVAALRAHRKAQAERRLLCGQAWQDLGLVVDRGDGGPVNPDSLSHAFADIAESVGLPNVRLHGLRHGYATACLRAGVPLKIVSEGSGTLARASRPTHTSTFSPAWDGRRRTPSRPPSATDRDQVDRSSSERQDATGQAGTQSGA